MKDLGGQVGEVTVLNKLTQMRETCLFGLWDLCNDGKDALHNSFLVLEASFFTQDRYTNVKENKKENKEKK